MTQHNSKGDQQVSNLVLYQGEQKVTKKLTGKIQIW